MEPIADSSGSREPFRFRGTFGHDNAHDAAKYWADNTWMSHPAHIDAFKHSVWGMPNAGEKYPSPDSREEFDSVTPGVNNEGVKGIYGKSGVMSKFISNDKVGAMHSYEREGVPSAGERAEAYNKRLPYNATQDQAAPGSQAARTFR